jgi:hypothetical protein
MDKSQHQFGKNRAVRVVKKNNMLLKHGALQQSEILKDR